jgi:peptidoglycan/LPS O-acetylase OafA/YrhL
MSARPEPLHQLTGLRAIAATWVLAFHLLGPARALFPAIGASAPVVEAGYLGVDVFFVLSGFVLAHAYARTLRFEPRALASFLWARVARVWPLHAAVTMSLVAAALAATLLHFRAFAQSPLFRGDELVAQLALVHAWGGHREAWNVPSWSVSAEWLAYLAFPLLCLAVARVRRPWILGALAGLVVGAFALYVRVAHAGSLDLTYSGAPARIAAGFTIGVLLERASRVARTEMRDPTLLGALGFVLAGVVLRVDAWILAPIAIFVVGLARSRGRIARALSAKPLLWLGERSYSLYLVHGPVMLVARGLFPIERALGWSAVARVGWLVGIIAVSVALSALALRFVEEPARASLRRLGRTSSTARA